MNTTINKNRIYTIVLILLCFFLISQLFQKCESRKVQLANIDSLNKELETYRLKNGQLVTSVENLNYTKEQLKKSILYKDKRVKELINNFSKVKSVTKIVSIVKFDTIKLIYNDSIPCKFERIGSDFQKWYHIAYKSNQLGVEITELSIPDSVIVATGDKRKWFWGKRTSVTDITHSNPFVETESVQHIEIIQPTKWYDTTIFKIGVGFLGGYLLLK